MTFRIVGNTCKVLQILFPAAKMTFRAAGNTSISPRMVFSVTKMTFFPAGMMIRAAKKVIFAAVQVFPAILQRIFAIGKVFPATRKVFRAACSSFRSGRKVFRGRQAGRPPARYSPPAQPVRALVSWTGAKGVRRWLEWDQTWPVRVSSTVRWVSTSVRPARKTQ